MEKHYCGECKNYVPLPGRARGKCSIRQYTKTRKGEETEFMPVRMRAACNSFVLSESGFKPVTIICKFCGKEAEKTVRQKQVFCSKECQIKWNREENKRKRAEEHNTKFRCHICGGVLEGNQKKYCFDCKGKIHKPIEQKVEKPKKKRRVLSISEINRRALAEHLSYGEYVMKYGL